MTKEHAQELAHVISNIAALHSQYVYYDKITCDKENLAVIIAELNRDETKLAELLTQEKG